MLLGAETSIMLRGLEMGKLFSIALLLLAGAVSAQTTAPQSILTSTWVATDALGRQVPEPGSTGIATPRANRWVGMFYYIWHGYHGSTVYDNTKLLAANPTNPAYGGQHAFHWWGEPEAGYYRSDDPWVIRRNMQMLASAGVDFIHFDLTNAVTYDSTVRTVCRIVKQMRAEGTPAPSVSASTWSSSGNTINHIYDTFYNNGECKDVWFMWNGKPLIFGNPSDAALRAEVKTAFDIKYSWAWTDAANQPDHWQWLDTYPQDYGWSGSKTNIEQMPVSSAQHPTSNQGKSLCNGVQPALNAYSLTSVTDQGIQFEQQWTQLHAKDPKVTMVTQWNEYMAQRFICNVGGDPCPGFLGHATVTNETWFVDTYNREFNRDIEPMKGGWTDNYYYQLVSHLRKVKGLATVPAAVAPKAIVIDGAFTDWTGVLPTFMDWKGDNAHRNWPATQSGLRYIDSTGRNDIVKSLVTLDAIHLNLYAETATTLTYSSDTEWMVLLLNTDRNATTGWHGYDWKVTGPISTSKRTLQKWNGTAWIDAGLVASTKSGKSTEIAIPRGKIGLTQSQVSLEFKWVDNISTLATAGLEDFSLEGDAAPDRRWNFLFEDTLAWLLPATSQTDLTPGVTVWRYPSTGTALPDFSAAPLDSGSLAGVTIPVGSPTLNFALRFETWLEIPAQGTYTLRLTSDDGSRLVVDGVQYLNHDGIHGMTSQEIALNFAKGFHEIGVDYFQNSGGLGLKLEWSGPGIAWQEIPLSVLWRAQHFTIPYAGAINLPGTLECENFNLGGESVAYHDTDPANTGAQYRLHEGVDLGANDSGNFVGWSAAGEWLRYTVNVARAGTYEFQLRASSPTKVNGALTLNLDGVKLGGPYSIASTGAFTTYASQILDTLTLPAGTHTLELQETVAGYNLDRVRVREVIIGPTGIRPPETQTTQPQASWLRDLLGRLSN